MEVRYFLHFYGRINRVRENDAGRGITTDSNPAAILLVITKLPAFS